MYVRRRLTGLNRWIWEWEKIFRFVSRINNYDFTSGLTILRLCEDSRVCFHVFLYILHHSLSDDGTMISTMISTSIQICVPLANRILAATGSFWRQKIWINVLFSEKKCEYFRKLQFLTRTKSLLKITFRYSFYSRCLIAGGVARESNRYRFLWFYSADTFS